MKVEADLLALARNAVDWDWKENCLNAYTDNLQVLADCIEERGLGVLLTTVLKTLRDPRFSEFLRLIHRTTAKAKRYRELRSSLSEEEHNDFEFVKTLLYYLGREFYGLAGRDEEQWDDDQDEE